MHLVVFNICRGKKLTNSTKTVSEFGKCLLRLVHSFISDWSNYFRFYCTAVLFHSNWNKNICLLSHLDRKKSVLYSVKCGASLHLVFQMSVIRGTYIALEHMNKLNGGQGGVIVNTASMAGKWVIMLHHAARINSND